MKTLVIILGETRNNELTFDNFKKNVIDELNADLCLCIGIKDDYDYYNPFYKLAKYKFLYNNDDYSGAFDYAYNNIINENKIENLNEKPLHWREFFIIKHQFIRACNYVYNLFINDKPLHWKEFLKINNNDNDSGVIQIYIRWLLLKNLKEFNLINKYDRFIITTNDYIYQLPHPKIEKMSINNIWILNDEYSLGYTDKHVILSKTNIIPYLNILNNIILNSNEYFYEMKYKYDWNIEQLIKFHLEKNNVNYLIKEFHCIMYSSKNNNEFYKDLDL